MAAHPVPPLVVLLLSLALGPSAAHADDTRIELIELQGRPAEELIPLLKPVVEPGGAITGSGYQLIVRASDAQLREIRRLLEQLDHAPRRLRITVHMGQLSHAERQAAELQIRKQAGDVGVEVGEPLPGDGARVRLHDTRSLTDARDRQQVQALEGQAAFIATGSARPYPAQVETWRGPLGGRGGTVAMEYREAATGFYAVARLRGDQVVIRISPQREAFDPAYPGAVTGQHMQTTVSGPLGSWLQVGGSGVTTRTREDGIGLSISTAETGSEPVWLKVDLMP